MMRMVVNGTGVLTRVCSLLVRLALLYRGKVCSIWSGMPAPPGLWGPGFQAQTHDDSKSNNLSHQTRTEGNPCRADAGDASSTPSHVRLRGSWPTSTQLGRHIRTAQEPATTQHKDCSYLVEAFLTDCILYRMM